MIFAAMSLPCLVKISEFLSHVDIGNVFATFRQYHLLSTGLLELLRVRRLGEVRHRHLARLDVLLVKIEELQEERKATAHVERNLRCHVHARVAALLCARDLAAFRRVDAHAYSATKAEMAARAVEIAKSDAKAACSQAGYVERVIFSVCVW